MASGDTVCVAIGEGSTYCIPSRGPLLAMPTPRPKEINQLISQSVSMVTMLCGYILHVHSVSGGMESYQVLWLPGSMITLFHSHLDRLVVW